MFKNLGFTATVLCLLSIAVMPIGGSVYSYKRMDSENPIAEEMTVDLLQRTDLDALSTYEI